MPNEKMTIDFSESPVIILKSTLSDISGVTKETKFVPTNIRSYLTLTSPEQSGIFLLKVHTPNKIYFVNLLSYNSAKYFIN